MESKQSFSPVMSVCDREKIYHLSSFSVCLDDLESFFCHNDLNGGTECSSSNLDNAAYVYFKLFILLYADDTVIMSESPNGLQSALNVYNDYRKQ